MQYGWETKKERLMKFASMTPKMKLEWLQKINIFLEKAGSAREGRRRRQLRALRH